jgi:hypothetical protein
MTVYSKSHVDISLYSDAYIFKYRCIYIRLFMVPLTTQRHPLDDAEHNNYSYSADTPSIYLHLWQQSSIVTIMTQHVTYHQLSYLYNTQQTTYNKQHSTYRI